MAELLISKGANVNALSTKENKSPLLSLCHAADKGRGKERHIEVAALLVAKGAQIWRPSQNGPSPFAWMVEYQSDDDEDQVGTFLIMVMMVGMGPRKDFPAGLDAHEVKFCNFYFGVTDPRFLGRLEEYKTLIAQYRTVGLVNASSASKPVSGLDGAMGQLGLSNLQSLWLDPELVTVGEELGQGATGKVHKGQLGDQQVAIKVITLPAHAGPLHPLVISLRDELMVVLHTSSSCPHLCHYMGVTMKGRECLIVMQLYKESLSDLMIKKPGGRLSVTDTLMHGMVIAQALDELHTQCVIHRDLKPDNILLTENGHLVLADFGIAATISTTMSCLHPNQLEGTLNYMAPEQLDSELDIGGVTIRSDMWGFGCTLLHMLTGKRPMEGKSLLQVMKAIAFEKKTHPIPDDLPAKLDGLIRRCLSFNPAARPTALEAVAAIRDAVTDANKSLQPAAIITQQLGYIVTLHNSPMNQDHWYQEAKVSWEAEEKAKASEEAAAAPLLEELRVALEAIEESDEDGADFLLLHLYKEHPPQRGKLDKTKLGDDDIRATLRQAILHYHPDKQASLSKKSQLLCAEIIKFLNAQYSSFR